MIQEWLGTTLGLISAVLAIILVGVATQLNTSSGFAGAGLISLMTFNSTLFYLVVSWTDLETSIGAVSRLKGFIETVKSENLPGEDRLPPAQWPDKGEVKINSVSASYQWVNFSERWQEVLTRSRSEDDSSSMSEKQQPPLALRNIDIEIKQGEKVAVCGRTGRLVDLCTYNNF
jgi:ATP-binding cassette, subfamily C (CFTR/MRP), member 1